MRDELNVPGGGSRCLWDHTVVNPVAYPALNDVIEADVAIVGGGLTGTRAAAGLAEAGASVAVLDAERIAFGASGRSGGQCNPMWRDTPDGLRRKIGAKAAERLIAATLTAGDDLFEDIRAYEAPCDPVQKGWLQAAHNAAAARDLETLGTAWRAEGARLSIVEGEEMRRISGAAGYRFGLLHATGGHVHPRSLTAGYAAAAAARGARIFDRSPVTSLTRKGDLWELVTPGGEVRAERVIVATNGYTGGLVPKLARTVLPLVSVILATAPLTPEQRAEVLPAQTTLSDTRRGIFYMRYDRDHRLVFGCIGSGDRVESFGGGERLLTGLRTVFPTLAGIETPFMWSGRIAVTKDMLPHLHEPAPGLTIGLGYCGRGIAMSSCMGRNLARRALGAPETELDFPITPIRPMPFHGVLKAVAPVAAPLASARDRIDAWLYERSGG